MIFIFIIIFLFVNYCKEKLHEFQNIKKSIPLCSRDFPGTSRGVCFGKGLHGRSVYSQPLGHGVYELAYDAGQKAVYAASAPSFEKDKTAGEVFQLAVDSLNVNERITTQRRPFAVSLDDASHILWLGNALDGSLTLLDTRTNKEVKTLQLADAENKAHVREVVLDKKHHRLYVSGIGSEGKGVLWVVDTQKQTLLLTHKQMDPVGFAVDEAGDKVYAVTGKGELITLDGKTSQVLSRVKVDPAEPKHYFLNIALNTDQRRWFYCGYQHP